jgi:lipid A disaccharide synthetase
MDTLTVTFFGHRYIDNFFRTEDKLQKRITELLLNNQYVEFLVGRNGDFDQLVSSTVLRCKRSIRDDNSSLMLVLPYPTAEFENNEDSFYDYYDEIEICEESSRTHFKNAMQVRNRSMVDRADLVICYIERNEGGAYQTIQYAKKQGKTIINLADIDDE